jgi:hypothetical protein
MVGDDEQSDIERHHIICRCRIVGNAPSATLALYFDVLDRLRGVVRMQFVASYIAPDNVRRSASIPRFARPSFPHSPSLLICHFALASVRVRTREFDVTSDCRQWATSIDANVAALLIARKEVLLVRCVHVVFCFVFCFLFFFFFFFLY